MSSLPASLPTLTTEQFRQRLAGLIDERDDLDEQDIADVKEAAVNFVSSLPIVFGEDLDRMTMWDKISAAIESAYAKTAADDCDFFVSSILATIQASPAVVARTEEIGMILSWVENVTPELRHEWLSYLATHRYAVLVRARARWEQMKQRSASHA